MATGSFTKKRLSITFALGKGSFGGSGSNTVTLSNLRASANIVKAGGASMGQAHIRVWGMTLDKMSQLSTLGMQPTAIRDNTVSVSAGNDVDGLGVVFEGTITDAWIDFQGMPDVLFNVAAYVGLLQAVKPVPATSYRGGASVATIMSGLATTMGLSFQNSGVDITLADPYFPGTAREQVQRCADAAGINWIIDDGQLAIWPKGKARGQEIPLVNPDTGMIGYPAFTSLGVMVTTIFNPSIGYGQKVKIESDLKPANGEWIVTTLTHTLEAEIPGGVWHTRFEAVPPGYAPVR